MQDLSDLREKIIFEGSLAGRPAGAQTLTDTRGLHQVFLEEEPKCQSGVRERGKMKDPGGFRARDVANMSQSLCHEHLAIAWMHCKANTYMLSDEGSISLSQGIHSVECGRTVRKQNSLCFILPPWEPQ